MRYFLAVAEELNVTRAARKLHIAQPPLSRQIHTLEHELGVALFHRTNKQISLTAAGRAFSKRARGVMEAVEAAVADAQRVQRHERGTLSIGLCDQIAYTLLPPILTRFSEKFPDIDVELKWFSFTDQTDALESQDFDIGEHRRRNCHCSFVSQKAAFRQHCVSTAERGKRNPEHCLSGMAACASL